MITLTKKDDEDDEIVKVAQLSVEDALKELNTEQAGLTIDEVHTLQQTYGKNVFAKAKQEPLWKKFIANFTSLMAILLWVAGIIAFCANLVQFTVLELKRENQAHEQEVIQEFADRYQAIIRSLGLGALGNR